MGIISNLHQCTFKSKGGVLCIATVSEKNERERERERERKKRKNLLQFITYRIQYIISGVKVINNVINVNKL